MTRDHDRPSSESAGDLREIIERDKTAALAEFDAAAFAHRMRRRVGEGLASSQRLPGRRLRISAGPGALVAAATVVVAIAVGALIVRVNFPRGPRTDPKRLARVLAGCEFFTSVPLDREPGSVAWTVRPTPARDLEWSIQALLYRTRRSSGDDAPVEGEVARVILTALTGAPPTEPASWPRVDPDSLARRIAILSREGAFLKALGSMR